MTLEEFKELVSKVNETSYEGFYRDGKIGYQWITGGMSGGSCWGNDNMYSMNGEPEPENTIIDEILLEVAPNISFLQYKKIRGAMSTDDKTRYEYYGNYTHYGIRYIIDIDMYNLLVQLRLI